MLLIRGSNRFTRGKVLENNAALITIGITCYNAADTISRAINSATVQDWPNTEIIIADDASTDTSVSIVQTLIKEIPNATLITHDKNKGPAGTRNTILENAHGEFLIFFDDDDESIPERLRVQHDKITKYETTHNQNIILCFASGTRHYDNGYELALEAIGSRGNISIPCAENMADRLLFYGGSQKYFYGFGTPTCALMARVSTLKSVGGFDETLRRVEDVDLAIRIALAGGHFIGCPEKLFLQHATNAIDKAPIKNLEAEQHLARKYKDYLTKKRRYHYALLWPKVRYHHFMGERSAMALAILHVMRYHPLKVPMQLLNTGIKRLWHEHKIKADK
jgi:glycosyltransferase involved in cell wall biosynthesis